MRSTSLLMCEGQQLSETSVNPNRSTTQPFNLFIPCLSHTDGTRSPQNMYQTLTHPTAAPALSYQFLLMPVTLRLELCFSPEADEFRYLDWSPDGSGAELEGWYTRCCGKWEMQHHFDDSPEEIHPQCHQCNRIFLKMSHLKR
jgi:hypothetical protein